MDPFLIFIALVIVFLSLLYFYGTATYDYWKTRGVEYIKPKYPLLGTNFETALSLKHTTDLQTEQYYTFKPKKYGGIFNFRKPLLIIADPNLVESILIKDFSYFYNRGRDADTKLDPLSAHLVNLRDEAWKSLRNKLTPVFTSGKLKGMHEQIVECSNNLVDFLSKYSQNGESFETKSVISNYTIDVISSCAFGLNANSLNDTNSKLSQMGLSVFKPSVMGKIRMVMRTQCPWLLRALNWRAVSKETEEFFKSTINDTLEHREKNGVIRPDFLHLMNELRKKDMAEKTTNGEKALIFDDQLLAANAFVFFVAGFETTASTISFALFELARNQDIQEKLYEQLSQAVKSSDKGETTYEVIKEVHYLEQVISETLRKYPPAPAVPREATKPYQVPGTSLVLPKGSMVMIPIHSLQHDPEYYPDPDKFMPERFSDENIKKIRKGTYLPFGDGPRICIGSRFAKLEAQVAIAKIVLNYRVKPSEKTPYPLKFNNSSLLLSVKGGIWLKVEARK